MRVLWLIPVLIAAIVGGGIPALRAMSLKAHAPAAIVAAAITLLASALAVIPLILTRQASLPARVQAGLVATVVHMMAAAALVALEMTLHLGGASGGVIYWLLPLYWATLIVLVIAITRTLRPLAGVAEPGQPASPRPATEI